MPPTTATAIQVHPVTRGKLYERNHPRLRQYTKDHTRAWSAQVAGALLMYVPSNLVNITFVHSRINDGVFVENKDVRAAADAMLDELLRLNSALSVLRTAS